MKKVIKLQDKIWEWGCINVGLIIQSIGIFFFLAKSKMAIGGLSGFSIILNILFPSLPIGALMLCANVILILIGFIVIGNSFGAKTIYCSFALSGLIWLYELSFKDMPLISQNPLVMLAMAAILVGTGGALIFNQNASTGGTDIIAKILNKYFCINMGQCMMIVDFFVAIFTAFVLGPEKGIFAFLGIVIISFFVDNISEGLNLKKQVIIISPKHEEIRSYITREIDRGATIYKAIGGFSQEERDVLMTIMSTSEFVLLKTFLKETDPDAFIIVSNVHEIMGIGFKSIRHT